MSVPTAHRIEATLGLDSEESLRLRRLLQGQLDPLEFESVERWVRQCYNMPSRAELIMEAANEVLDGFGVEALWPRGETAGSCVPPVATYVNQGDPYTLTLIRFEETGHFALASWGDVVESRRL
jgi:hypothetical protein